MLKILLIEIKIIVLKKCAIKPLIYRMKVIQLSIIITQINVKNKMLKLKAQHCKTKRIIVLEIHFKLTLHLKFRNKNNKN